MDSPSLGLRLGAEALGTFLFFFLGFNAIAVSVDIGAGAIEQPRDRVRVRPRPRAGDRGARTHLRRPLQPRGVPRPRRGAEVPAEGGRPVLDRAARRRLRRRSRGRRGVLGTRGRRARHCSGGRHLERGRAPARADRDRPLRHRDLHRRDRRPCALEGRHGAAADRALHLHGGGRDRPGVGWLVQPSEIARPGPLQLATSTTSGSTSSGRSSEA